MLWALALLLIGIGLVGTVLPGLPGPVAVFGGFLLAAWADDFARIGPGTLVVLALLTIAAHVVDIAGVALGVRRSGASGRAAAGATLGALVGLVFGVPGLLIGPFLGAITAELSVRKDLRGAGRAGIAAWIGFIVGTVAKLALVVAMFGIGVAAFLL